MSLSPPGSLLLTVLRQWFWCGSYFMLIRVGISCCLYSVASYLLYAVLDQLPRLGKRELVFLLLFTCSFVVTVLGRFLFLLVLGMDCAFLLWHSLDLPLIILFPLCILYKKEKANGKKEILYLLQHQLTDVLQKRGCYIGSPVSFALCP